MKALQINEYGDPSKLEIAEVEKPTIKDNQVLLKVKASGINPFDVKLRAGFLKGIMPMQMPLRFGWEVAGIIESIGNNVKKFKVGDEIYAMTDLKDGGTDAEFVAVNEAELVIKPKSLSFVEAAAVPTTATTAYYFLINLAKLRPGQKILIHGAAGNVGSFAVQIAKLNNAYIIATTSGDGMELIKSLGADEVIDYTKTNFETVVKDVDVVLDLVGGDFQMKSFSTLKKGGILVSTVMPPSQDKAIEFGVTAQFASTPPDANILNKISEWIEEGKLKIKAPTTFSLEHAQKAYEIIENRKAKGKLVFEI